MIDIFVEGDINRILTWDTWGPLTSNFFIAVSKKWLNSFDKLLSSDITLS